MQDFVETGDVRKYDDFDNMVTRGSWVLYTDGRVRISYNKSLWSQGWQTERLFTSMHEGKHNADGGGTEEAAQVFEANCVNW